MKEGDDKKKSGDKSENHGDQASSPNSDTKDGNAYENISDTKAMNRNGAETEDNADNNAEKDKVGNTDADEKLGTNSADNDGDDSGVEVCVADDANKNDNNDNLDPGWSCMG